MFYLGFKDVQMERFYEYIYREIKFRGSHLGLCPKKKGVNSPKILGIFLGVKDVQRERFHEYVGIFLGI